MNMSTHKQYELKKVLMELYRPIVGTGNNISNNENLILCYKNSKTGVMEETRAFNNIDDFIIYIANSRRTSYCETYFNLYTSENDQRKTEYIKTACFIGLDFDRKDFEAKGIELNINYIQSKFHEIGLFYNLLVNSGNGIHVYIYIEPTENIDLVVKVAKEIAKRSGADINACKPTQLLRVPFTFNNKQLSEGIKKPVVLIHMDESPMRKDINKIAKKLFRKETGTNKTLKITNGCMKINDLTTIPIEKGISRHEELLWLYGKLLQFNTTQGQIMVACEKFQELNNLEDFEYQVKWLKENGKSLSPCGNCKYKGKCHNYIEEDIDYTSGQYFETTEKTIKKCSKKGNGTMSGDMLVVYALLKVYYEGITQTEILEQLSKNEKKKPCISKPTLIKLLKEMEQMKLIEVTTEGNKKLYKLNSKVDNIKHEEYKFLINFASADKVIQGQIKSEDLRLYCFMKYLHNVEKRTNKKTGNVFSIRQMELSRLYGEDQGNISKRINRLEEYGLLGIVYRKSIYGRDYYIYKLKF